ncbi:hypothetical protein SBRY_20175 [Actinacidiphila bryophytorum]|uniref:Uncharacterized protein n=1 Tax=Actinacidiphila bryophytorum TaxID=1436133 RepID=A0A9W4GZ71_9ACTN|nr:hypothetical protein SBRY_20175 [Actinacidiphila bryophytorum]
MFHVMDGVLVRYGLVVDTAVQPDRAVVAAGRWILRVFDGALDMVARQVAEGPHSVDLRRAAAASGRKRCRRETPGCDQSRGRDQAGPDQTPAALLLPGLRPGLRGSLAPPHRLDLVDHLQQPFS